MAARGGQAGNKNAAKAKEWEQALRYALLNYESAEFKVKRGQALKKIAKGVVEKAIAGDKDAWQEIGNRLDGKPAQSITGADGEDLRLFVEVVRFANPDTR